MAVSKEFQRKVHAVLDGEADLRQVIHSELVARVCEGFGYSFDSRRLDRISKESSEAMRVGMSFPQAFAHALELELVMYGDPDAKKSAPAPIVGILSVK